MPKPIIVHHVGSELITYVRGDGYSASYDTAALGTFDTVTEARQAISEHKLALIERGLIDTDVLKTAEEALR
jgi:hypothetical protein